MRMFLSVLLAAAAIAVPAPAEDTMLTRPGYSIVPPGGRLWSVIEARQTRFAPRDGSERGVFTDRIHYTFGRVKDSGSFTGFLWKPLLDPALEKTFGPKEPDIGDIVISASVVPTAASTREQVLAMLREELTKRLAGIQTPERENLTGQMSEATIGGAVCMRWDGTASEPGGVFGRLNHYLHRIICSHPDFAAYVVYVDFTLRDRYDRSEKEGLAALDTLKFTPLDYRGRFIPLGTLPQQVAQAEGSLWVTYGDDRGMVARIDPKTNSVVKNIPVGAGPIGVAADASGIWVANAKDNSVSQIDPRTNKVVRTIPVGKSPHQIAAGAGSIWVTLSGAGAVARIDPATGAVKEIAGMGTEPSAIAFANGSVYVVDYQGAEIVRIDPATNKPAGRLAGAQSCNAIVPDGGHVWINSQAREPLVLRIDTASGAPVRFADVDYMPGGMALWNGKLYVAHWLGMSIGMLDPANPQAKMKFVPAGEAPMMALVSDGSLWVVASGASGPARGGLVRLDAK